MPADDAPVETELGSSAMPRHAIWILVYPGFQPLDAAGPHEVFGAANRVADHRRRTGVRYDLRVVSPDSPITIGESGLGFATVPLPADGDPATLLIVGGDGVNEACAEPALVDWVRRVGARSDRVATVCSGALLGAAAGLLDGHRVTTHWRRAAELATRHPELAVDPDAIYLTDRRIWTSAGVTAGIDLALAIVEQDLGADVAQEVARQLVVFQRRPGGQSQFAPSVWAGAAHSTPIRQAQTMIDRDPGMVGSIAALAGAVGLSPRHFSRRFAQELGQTPARYIESVRIEAARGLLERDGASVDEVARVCGFGSAETLRRAFHRRLGTSPHRYRHRFGSDPGHTAHDSTPTTPTPPTPTNEVIR